MVPSGRGGHSLGGQTSEKAAWLQLIRLLRDKCGQHPTMSCAVSRLLFLKQLPASFCASSCPSAQGLGVFGWA